jgi:hypothetical protein
LRVKIRSWSGVLDTTLYDNKDEKQINKDKKQTNNDEKQTKQDEK